MKKRLLSFIMVAMLAVSAAAMPDYAPDVSEKSFTVYASANYANAQMKEYAMEVAGIVNRERAANGLSPLKYSDKLSEAALVRAEEIQSVFSHTRPNGTRCFTAVTEAGIHYSSVGENIAYGQRNPDEVMDAWMNSSGHRANILGNYDYIGVGVTYKNGTYYWSQFFAVSNNLTGEVVSTGGTKTTSSTTKPTTKATSSTTKPTTKATSSTTKPTTKATSSTTKPTTKATSSTTKPTTKATSSATKPTSGAEEKNTSNSCKSSLRSRLINKLKSMLGIKD